MSKEAETSKIDDGEALALQDDNLHRTAAVLVVHSDQLERAGAAFVLSRIDALPQIQQNALAGVVDVLDYVRVSAEKVTTGRDFFDAKLALR